jgi:hypothetical protein
MRRTSGEILAELRRDPDLEAEVSFFVSAGRLANARARVEIAAFENDLEVERFEKVASGFLKQLFKVTLTGKAAGLANAFEMLS